MDKIKGGWMEGVNGWMRPERGGMDDGRMGGGLEGDGWVHGW